MSRFICPPDMCIDVSIVTYNSERYLDDLIESLCEQDIGSEKLNVRFVDNDSTDDTVVHLKNHASRHGTNFGCFEIIENPRNLGFGRGHNRAVEQGAAPFVFILNPDTRLYPDCLSELMGRAIAEEETVGAWEPRQIPYEHPKQYDPVLMEPPWCAGAALLIRRTAFEAVKGFDRHIFIYCEDVDLSWRLKRDGWKLRYVPSACVRHDTYDAPNQVKPAQFIYSILGNQFLRTRFGSMREMAAGWFMYLAVLFGPKYFPGQRKGLLRISITYTYRFLHFVSPRRRTPGIEFHGWDYAPVRDGAFHEVVPYQDIDTPPLVSVLVRTIGRKAQVRRALQSIANQTWRNIEAVVVEDGPATIEDVVAEFPHVSLTYVPLGVNRGRCHAGNVAMERASGEYFCFLDEDDELYADHIEQLYVALRDSSVQAVYSSSFEVKTEWDDQFNIVREGTRDIVYNEEFSFVEMSRRNLTPICNVLFSRRLYEKCGGLDPRLDNLEDWDLWLRFIAEGGRFARLPKTTALYRLHMHPKSELDRRNELHSYYELVRTKHRETPITLTIGNLASEADALHRSHVEMLGITPEELRALKKLSVRLRFVRFSANIMRRTLMRMVFKTRAR